MSTLRRICVYCGSGPGSDPAFAAAARRFGQILAEQRIDDLLSNWLKTLRAQAHIERMLPASAPLPNAGAEP